MYEEMTKEQVLAKYSMEQIKEFHKRIHPPAPKLTRKQVEAAREKAAFYKIFKNLKENNFNLKVALGEVKPRENLNLFTPDWLEKQRVLQNKKLKDISDELINCNALNGDSFSKKIISDDYVRYQLASLSDYHVGDCTQVPATCSRCLAESFFDLQYSDNWSKKEGFEMLTVVATMGFFNDYVGVEELLENPENFNLDDLEN